MTKEELAQQLDGIEYPGYLQINNIKNEAKDSGLVIAYGQSDDLLEFEGAISNEVEALDGKLQRLCDTGIPRKRCDDENCPYDREWLEICTDWVRAEWCPDDSCSWRITASVPTASFRIMEDGEVYCEAIVFEMASLRD